MDPRTFSLMMAAGGQSTGPFPIRGFVASNVGPYYGGNYLTFDTTSLNLQDGDQVFVWVCKISSTSGLPDGGWSLVDTLEPPGTNNWDIYVRTVTAGADQSSISIGKTGPGGTTAAAWMVGVRGASTTLVKSAIGDPGDTGTLVAASVTAPAGGGLLITLPVNKENSGAFGSISGMEKVLQRADPSAINSGVPDNWAVFWEEVPAGATGTRTVTPTTTLRDKSIINYLIKL